MNRKRFGRNFPRYGCVINHSRLQSKKTARSKEDGKGTKRCRSGWHKAMAAGVRAPAVGRQEK